MVESGFVPKRGEIVWLDFDPQTGREQRGRRPAFVLSPKSYNERVGLALFCPVTNQVKHYPFEVEIPEGYSVAGVILVDHIKSLDWRARRAELLCELPHTVIEEVLAKIEVLLR